MSASLSSKPSPRIRLALSDRKRPSIDALSSPMHITSYACTAVCVAASTTFMGLESPRKRNRAECFGWRGLRAVRIAESKVMPVEMRILYGGCESGSCLLTVWRRWRGGLT